MIKQYQFYRPRTQLSVTGYNCLLQKVDHQGENVKLSDSAILATLGKIFYWSISAWTPSGSLLSQDETFLLQIQTYYELLERENELINIYKGTPCLKSTEKKVIALKILNNAILKYTKEK